MTVDPKNRTLSQEVKRLWKNGLFRSACMIALVVFGVLAFRQVLIFALNTEYPLQTPVSGSMEPTLNIGDLLIVRGVSGASDIYANPGDGDIIVFPEPNNPGDLIVHRAIAKVQIGETWYFTTKGDNNQSPDPWRISEDDLVGKVIWHIPLLGYIKIYLGTPVGMLISIALLLAIMILEIATSEKKTEEPPATEEKAKDSQNPGQ